MAFLLAWLYGAAACSAIMAVLTACIIGPMALIWWVGERFNDDRITFAVFILIMGVFGGLILAIRSTLAG